MSWVELTALYVETGSVENNLNFAVWLTALILRHCHIFAVNLGNVITYRVLTNYAKKVER